jgi:hypothetical protein
VSLSLCAKRLEPILTTIFFFFISVNQNVL